TFEISESLTLPRGVAEQVIRRIGEEGLDVWVYAGLHWYLRDGNAPHREKEEHTVQFAPTVVPDFEAGLEQGAAKIVGVSDDYALVERVEKIIQDEFAGLFHTKPSSVPGDHYSSGPAEAGPSVSAARSQPYYLDVTHPRANKGGVVEMLVAKFGIPAESIVTMGDMPNDVLMFEKSGFSIAMGQSNDGVKNAADRVSLGLNDEGFAHAVENFILGDE
ncbi:MAG: HAD hydrolase family protein, partial [Chthoniobacterales bacterium]